MFFYLSTNLLLLLDYTASLTFSILINKSAFYKPKNADMVSQIPSCAKATCHLVGCLLLGFNESVPWHFQRDRCESLYPSYFSAIITLVWDICWGNTVLSSRLSVISLWDRFNHRIQLATHWLLLDAFSFNLLEKYFCNEAGEHACLLI